MIVFELVRVNNASLINKLRNYASDRWSELDGFYRDMEHTCVYWYTPEEKLLVLILLDCDRRIREILAGNWHSSHSLPDPLFL